MKPRSRRRIALLIVVAGLAGVWWLRHPPGYVRTLSVSGVPIGFWDNDTLAVATSAGLRLWNMTRDAPAAIQTLDSSALRWGVWSADHTLWAALPGVNYADVYHIVVVDLRTGALVRTLSCSEVARSEDEQPCLTFSPDRKILAAAARDGRVWLWDVPTGKLLRVLKGQRADLVVLAFSPDGQSLAAAVVMPGGPTRLWVVRTGQQRLALDQAWSNVAGLSFTPNGASLITFSTDGTEQGWNLYTGTDTFLRTYHNPHYGGTYPVSFSADGSRYATGGTRTSLFETPEGEVHVWQTGTGRELFEATRGLGRVERALVSPDGHRLIIYESQSGDYQHYQIGVWRVD